MACGLYGIHYWPVVYMGYTIGLWSIWDTLLACNSSGKRYWARIITLKGYGLNITLALSSRLQHVLSVLLTLAPIQHIAY